MTAQLSRGTMTVEYKQQVEQQLRSSGVQPTKQRMEIGILLLATPQHMSADQILGELRTAGSRVSKATVYNTLNLFACRGLVREVSVDSTRQFFDSTIHPHHHFYNIDTGKLTDIGIDELEFSQLPELPSGTEAQDVEVIVRVRNKH
ncbi:MAG: transcriptional repressor [Chromatiales bacterium]|jgi:Fur family iron response transcriptional regulator|nr:transcriptional repressor [Chromatiales bacterium]